MPSLKEAKADVIYKVGRNVLLFQQIEHLLKFLVVNGNASGHPSQLAANTKRRVDSVMKRTLGMVAKDYLDVTDPSPPPADLNEPHFSFSFRMDYHTDKKEVMEALIAERNHLVHHFLLDIDIESLDDWIEAGEKLDKQSEKLEAELSELHQVVERFQEMRRDMADFVLSDEFRDQFLK
jgi:hypothetical protein